MLDGFKKQQFKIDLFNQPLTLTISSLAEQANASVLGQYGDTSVLVTAVMSKEDKDTDFFPLVIDFEERFYAAGKIIGSRFIRREGRPSENAILSARLIDRSIRPLFDKRIRRDLQVVITVLSYDEENDPDFIALLSTSLALSISNIPFNGPVAGLRIARTKDGETIFNPVNSLFVENGYVLFDAFISGTEKKINMIEFSGEEVKEADIVESFKLAHKEIKKLINFQKDIIKKIGRKKAQLELIEPDKLLEKKVKELLHYDNRLEKALYISEKTKRQAALTNLKQDLLVQFPENQKEINYLFEKEIKDLIHKKIIKEEKRPDNRKLDEIRNLYAEVSLFKRLHGSALFVRGSTQSLAVVTLAPPGQEQLIETMEVSEKRRFMLHYNFPPFSTGEVGRIGSVGRREIGHGNLAEKALRPLIPSQDEFPYTIRVVSEILSSNGSSSMASVCSGSLALMDAGVPIKKAVAGIAMGLIYQDDKKYKILTDIQGPEDAYGDMDFKVAGTKDGITAIQLDVKIEGLTFEMIKETLEKAKKARLKILDYMNKIISAPREKISSYAPVILTTMIKPEQIGEVIGPGGKIINTIIQKTGVEAIDIEPSGKVFVSAPSYEAASLAIKSIKAITKEYQTGEIIEGEVSRILDFGAIVDLGAGKTGLLHISEISDKYIKDIKKVLKIGQKIKVKIIKIDEDGRISLSMKEIKE